MYKQVYSRVHRGLPTPAARLSARALSTSSRATPKARPSYVASAQAFQFSPLKQNRAAFFSTSSRVATAVLPNEKQSRDGAAQQVSEEILDHVPLVDVKKVLVVGSGGLSIGQAGEFDYSGKLMIRRIFIFFYQLHPSKFLAGFLVTALSPAYQ